jgi:ACS family allantoate permease-like MFS transporter
LFTTMIFEVLALRWVNIRQNEQKAIKLAALIEANGWTEEDVKRESDRAAVSTILIKRCG